MSKPKINLSDTQHVSCLLAYLLSHYMAACQSDFHFYSNTDGQHRVPMTYCCVDFIYIFIRGVFGAIAVYIRLISISFSSSLRINLQVLNLSEIFSTSSWWFIILINISLPIKVKYFLIIKWGHVKWIFMLGRIVHVMSKITSLLWVLILLYPSDLLTHNFLLINSALFPEDMKIIIVIH